MVFEQVKAALAEQLAVNADRITMETDIIEDLGADSLDLVELMLAMEEKFNLVITNESMYDVKTVGEIVRMRETLV